MALSARSVVLSTLLGTDPPQMSVARLLRVTDLFGLTPGSVRTALTRMVARGELRAVGDGRYALSGRLIERQRRQAQSRAALQRPWDGTWRVGVVTADARSAAVRSELRTVMAQLRYAAQREGVWTRPDNLDPDRLPDAQRVADAQCAWWSAQPDLDGAQLAAALWDLHAWATRAEELRVTMDRLIGALEAHDTAALAPGFVLSADVLRHLQADPLLPVELLPPDWPGERLRRDYDRYDHAYRTLLREWFGDR
jgi:phenylacetic acid degradation operon negative regulatory protein